MQNVSERTVDIVKKKKERHKEPFKSNKSLDTLGQSNHMKLHFQKITLHQLSKETMGRNAKDKFRSFGSIWRKIPVTFN